MNKFDVFVGEGLNHRPSVEIISINIGDVAAFYFGVIGSHLFVVCFGVAFGTYEC